MKGALISVIVLVFLSAFSVGDINLHNPRGSNNRLNEAKADRTNPNRLFNSQNNNRGGHNVGVEPLKFYGGSKLRIEWANQHSCGDENNNCELILQYMCGEHVRDGTTTNTPPTNHALCQQRNCTTDHRFGMHESYEYYKKCSMRGRNRGLFIADQTVRDSARSTRQNPAGARYGYECQEERDYYPYWGSSPWKDIAIFTNNPGRCHYYQRESQNVKPRPECTMEDEAILNSRASVVSLFVQKRDCEYSTEKIGTKTYRGKWVTTPQHGLDPPECFPSPWSRDNHQGNTLGGQFMSYDWTVPNLEDENCVIRIRYNISTNDYDGWNTDDCRHGPREIWERFGMTQREAVRRQYQLKKDQDADVFNVLTKKKRYVRLSLAIDTSQFGRTFQDRSHVFKILHRPKDYGDTVIHNVNVRGKRGNIVQVYPSVEYDFVPNTLEANLGDMVHFQWTGSDTNPAGNAGQGTDKTDRSNVVELARRTFSKGIFPVEERNKSITTNYPVPPSKLLSNEEVNRRWNFLGLGWQATEDLAHLERCGEEDPLLDEKSAYYDLGPQLLTETGTYYYMSTRNNAFSNRDQKATVKVAEETYKPTDNGSSYRGFVSKTKSGITCQRWDEQRPHTHKYYNPANTTEQGLESNYCRNPNQRQKPWCFTTDPDVKWEYCTVPKEAPVRRKREIEKEDAVFPQTDDDMIMTESLD